MFYLEWLRSLRTRIWRGSVVIADVADYSQRSLDGAAGASIAGCRGAQEIQSSDRIWSVHGFNTRAVVGALIY